MFGSISNGDLLVKAVILNLTFDFVAENTVYSGLVVIFGVAKLMADNYDAIRRIQLENDSIPVRNVLYALFDGQSYGQVGSDAWTFYTNLVVRLVRFEDNKNDLLVQLAIRIKLTKVSVISSSIMSN